MADIIPDVALESALDALRSEQELNHELLAALKVVIHTLDQYGSAEQSAWELLEQSAMFRAAITKAESR